MLFSVQRTHHQNEYCERIFLMANNFFPDDTIKGVELCQAGVRRSFLNHLLHSTSCKNITEGTQVACTQQRC